MKAIFLTLTLITSSSIVVAGTPVSITKCAINAQKVMKAIEKTYKNPANLELESSKESRSEAQYVYTYNFDYAVPYDDTGRGTIESRIVEIRTTNWDCSVNGIDIRMHQ